MTERKSGSKDATGQDRRLNLRRLRPAYEQVADQLREQILDGTLRSGDRLPSESELIELFGVSRSTLREALRILAARDLVRTQRGVTGGTFVARVDPETVGAYLATSMGLMATEDILTAQEIVEAREIVEIPAVRLAAQRATPADIAALRSSSRQRTARQVEPSRYNEHKTFHSLVVEASKNRLLVLMNRPNFKILESHFRRHELTEDWWAQVDEEHVHVADLIGAGQADEAAEAMRQHLERLRELYLPISDMPGASSHLEGLPD